LEGSALYKITIERTRSVKTTLGHEWQPLNRDKDGKAEYGYTPEYTGDKTILEELYTQRVEELDLAAIVAVVNGIHASNGQLAPA
jgi:hypothetical protein